MHVNLPQKLYYSIGEISKAFNVNASLIRFWEKEFKQIKPKILNGNRRYYNNDTIEVLKNHGILKGSWFAFKRILRCHPFCKGGYDPEPK